MRFFQSFISSVVSFLNFSHYLLRNEARRLCKISRFIFNKIVQVFCRNGRDNNNKVYFTIIKQTMRKEVLFSVYGARCWGVSKRFSNEKPFGFVLFVFAVIFDLTYCFMAQNAAATAARNNGNVFICAY